MTAFSSWGEWGLLLVVVLELHLAVASLVADHSLQVHGLWQLWLLDLVAQECGIFPDQGSNWCSLHCKADSKPLDYQGISLSSVQFSRSVVSDSLWPPARQTHEFTQTHVHWVRDAIQPSHPVIPFSSCLQSFPASESFPMSQLFTWGDQSIGVSALASVLPTTTQDWSPLEWTGWISLQAKGLSRVFSNTTVQKHQFFGAQLSSQSNSHIHTCHWKNHSLD